MKLKKKFEIKKKKVLKFFKDQSEKVIGFSVYIAKVKIQALLVYVI
jgi:hypothetical protein